MAGHSYITYPVPATASILLHAPNREALPPVDLVLVLHIKLLILNDLTARLLSLPRVKVDKGCWGATPYGVTRTIPG